jgi:hypothetical protein
MVVGVLILALIHPFTLRQSTRTRTLQQSWNLKSEFFLSPEIKSYLTLLGRK